MKTKNLIESFVSFGAALVVLGALFKLEHLAFASTFLWVGLITEAIIFTIYGFQYLFHKKKDEIVSASPGVPAKAAHHTDKLSESVDNLHETIKTIFNR